MADKEHIQTLIGSLASLRMTPWNHWRIENPSIRPDLSGAELADANLSFANMSYADISHADLSRTNLHHANLRHADLSHTILRGADLSEADLSGSILEGADLRGAILRKAELRRANLVGANFENANLKGADLTDTLIEPGASEGRKSRSGGAISYFEKLALGIFARAKEKDPLPVKGSAKSRRSGKHT